MSDNEAAEVGHRISATNLGPIPEVEFWLKSPGVTVLVAPNGSGKSILLEAVQAAAQGEGKLPLRDRTRKGKVEAFGAIITIGQNCRHTGKFEVVNIEGKFDLAGLVDPRLKTAAASDKARIKALVSLTGVEASVDLFRNHEAFEDFDTVVSQKALATDDLIEMAAKIKDCYDDAALKQENLSEREFGQATALIPGSDIDLDAESDAAVLQAAYNEARDEVTRLTEQARNAESAKKRVADAKDLLAKLGSDELRAERKKLTELIDDSQVQVESKRNAIRELESQIAGLKVEIGSLITKASGATTQIETIDRQLALVDEASKVLADSSLVDPPDEDDIEDAKVELEHAAAAMEQGVKIRAAKENAKKVALHRKAAKEATERAARYRDAAKTTNEVLSASIQCPQLRVESDGKAARIVTDLTVRGPSTAYHDLSDGERWTIAIDIGADQVGEGGLLVISQIGWEGIDGKNRLVIHNRAIERGVYILTAEAATDPTAPKEIKPLALEEAEAEQVRGNLVAAEMSKQKRLERSADGAAPKEPAKNPDPPKAPGVEVVEPKAKAPAKKAPSKPSPPAEEFDDDGEIPF